MPATPPHNHKPDNFLLAAARYTAIATTLPAAAFAGYLLGYWLDRYLGTTFWKIVLLLLGIAGGFVQLIRELLRDTKSK
jgi:F0F1-type ATP synthase assembly protein I